MNGHANNFKIEPEDNLEIEANAENQVQRIQDDRNCQFFANYLLIYVFKFTRYFVN